MRYLPKSAGVTYPASGKNENPGRQVETSNGVCWYPHMSWFSLLFQGNMQVLVTYGGDPYPQKPISLWVWLLRWI